MSKAHDPHWRYVAIKLSGETRLSRRTVSNAILGRARREDIPDDEAPQLTRYEWPHAIVRVHHYRLADAREWLPRITWAVEAATKVPLTVETLSSSGTIKALTTRIGVLTERGEAPPKANKGSQRGPSPPKYGNPRQSSRKGQARRTQPPAKGRQPPAGQPSSVPPPGRG